ncbi:hydrolase 1, exosortase A system-associated [Colwellia psychrerythraea]|uniref:Hydrolase, exosortase system type 1 associated protein n=1 Tax=Colwellia psychrerythraea TaxID=28229 RepID=A0A099L396_COLPS|nr:hydrolase 1, exosortase A system-associated [Colwellia psychrerythraea]KGJ97331.1 hydrolase, exosortase system type 1 associated protein [Colwellia psychrerythraea]
MIEQGVIFNSNGKQLIAIEHLPMVEALPSDKTQAKKGLIIVVGGPQTRVGSHRLFVYLARALAKRGITVFRFDYTGAGDSEGEISPFTNVKNDISAAIDTFKQRHDDITDLALWGLCDAASAILLYLNETAQQDKIKHLFLVNPWVRQTHTAAKTYLRSYYIKRIVSKDFWHKLLSGKVKGKMAFGEIKSFHKQSQVSQNTNTADNFVTQMLQGLDEFTGKCNIMLSGNDLTADEFKLLVKSNKHWRDITARDTIDVQTISQTDHTFSQRDKQNQLVKLVCRALVK